MGMGASTECPSVVPADGALCLEGDRENGIPAPARGCSERDAVTDSGSGCGVGTETGGVMRETIVDLTRWPRE